MRIELVGAMKKILEETHMVGYSWNQKEILQMVLFLTILMPLVRKLKPCKKKSKLLRVEHLKVKIMRLEKF